MVERLFLPLVGRALARPRRALAAAALVTVAAAPGLARLDLRTDGHTLAPDDDPAIARDAEIRRHFGLLDPVVVLVQTRHPDGLYNPATLRRVRGLTDALATLDWIAPGQLTSLATEPRDREDSYDTAPYLEPLPSTAEELGALRRDVEAVPILAGTLVAVDGRGAAVLVGVPSGRGAGDRTAYYRDVVDAVAGVDPGEDTVRVVGAPVAEALLGSHVLDDLRRLVPISIAAIALVLWLGTRRLWAVALGLLEVLACTVFTFGLMGWLGVPVFLTTAILPVVLTTVGLTDELHLLWHYQRRLAAGGETRRAAVQATLAAMTRPVVLTSLTTALGFASFAASDLAPVRYFGLFAAVGIVFCMLWSLLVMPASFLLLPEGALDRPAGAGARWRLQGRWLLPLLARRRATLSLLAVATLVLGAGMLRLHVQDGWIEGFAPGSPFRQATEEADAALLGTHVLLAQVAFDLPEEAVPELDDVRGPLLNPDLLAELGAFEDFLRRQPGVGGVLGLHDYLTNVAYLISGRAPGSRVLPDGPWGVRHLLRRLDLVQSARRHQVVDEALERTVVTLFLEGANYRDTARLMAAVDRYAADRLAPLGAEITYGGDIAVSQAMIPAIVRTQMTSLSVALAGAFLVVALLEGSFRRGLLALLPAAVATVWTFGLMGWTGIPLGVATSMFCAITLGIGVDFAIHFLHGVRRSEQRVRAARVREALTTVGPVIAIDTLALGLGFGIMVMSEVPANARLGLTVAATLSIACALTLVGLGSVLHGRTDEDAAECVPSAVAPGRPGRPGTGSRPAGGVAGPAASWVSGTLARVRGHGGRR